jgi:hypothetical protein
MNANQTKIAARNAATTSYIEESQMLEVSFELNSDDIEVECEEEADCDEDGYVSRSQSWSLKAKATVTLNGILKVNVFINGDEAECDDSETLVETTDEEDELINVWLESFDWAQLNAYIMLVHGDEVDDAFSDAKSAYIDSAECNSDPYRYHGVSRHDF